MQLDPTWQELLLSAIAASAMWVSSLGLSSSALFNFYSRLNFNVEKRVTCVLPNAGILLFLFSSFFFYPVFGTHCCTSLSLVPYVHSCSAAGGAVPSARQPRAPLLSCWSHLNVAAFMCSSSPVPQLAG